ncbi:MAG: pyridoxamine 5'-phosphate oxidase family protein [Sphingomonadales bacterium]|nr:pyridoxamine 5'-phosphate oxidase family protein [Sphingomonadales bacterium]
MPSRRDMIAMTPQEVSAYLASQQRLIVVSNGPHGYPHPVPMNFGIDADGRLIILTFAKSQKVRNLERDPRAALLVESGTHYHALKSVVIYASAEIIGQGDEFERCREAFARKTQTVAAPGSSIRNQVDASMAKRVAIRFTPERVISWDHAKLGSKY